MFLKVHDVWVWNTSLILQRVPSDSSLKFKMTWVFKHGLEKRWDLKHILENRWDIIFQDKCFLVFDVTDDAFAEYTYHDFPKEITKRNVNISKLTLVNDVYFEFRFHFITMLTDNANQEKVYNFHVVLDEANVAKIFWRSY